jgi:hypothetical protein
MIIHIKQVTRCLSKLYHNTHSHVVIAQYLAPYLGFIIKHGSCNLTVNQRNRLQHKQDAWIPLVASYLWLARLISAESPKEYVPERRILLRTVFCLLHCAFRSGPCVNVTIWHSCYWMALHQLHMEAT